LGKSGRGGKKKKKILIKKTDRRESAEHLMKGEDCERGGGEVQKNLIEGGKRTIGRETLKVYTKSD